MDSPTSLPSATSHHTIRVGRTDDADRLAVLATHVWLHTYATDGVNDLVAQYVLSELTPHKFRQAIESPTNCLFVAERGLNLLGFALFTFDAACPAQGTNSSAELKTLYVQAHHVGQGVGKSLLDAAEITAREQAQSALWLKVNANNARAIAFYANQGYSKIGTAYFVLGEGRHENHVLVDCKG